MLNDVYSESLAEDLRHLGEEVADAMTRPSVLYRPTLSVYGDKYCMLYGPNIAEGVAGFGDTAAEAASAFDRVWKEGPAPRMVANTNPTAVDKWQVGSCEGDDEPPDDAPDGFEPCGHWEPLGVGPYQSSYNGGPEDMTTITVWRRPLKAVQ